MSENQTENQDRGDNLDDDSNTTSGDVETVEAPERNDKGQFIPKARFDEAVHKERERTRAAEARAQELEGVQQARDMSADITQAQTWVKEAVRKRNAFLMDGEVDKASDLDDKILAVQDAIAERKADMKAEAAKNSSKTEIAYDMMVDKLEAMYPELDPDGDNYDAEGVAEIRALVIGYRSELKLSPAKALEKAVKRVFGTTSSASKETNETGLRRKTEAVGRNVETSKRQPPSTKDIGIDHDKKGGGLDAKTVMKMDYSEFSKLDEKLLSKLRGDDI